MSWTVFLAKLRQSFKDFLTEIKQVLGLEKEVPNPDTQLLVNRVVAGAVMATAAALWMIPGNWFLKRAVADALFVIAVKLWSGEVADNRPWGSVSHINMELRDGKI